jgi:hypothetical protein
MAVIGVDITDNALRNRIVAAVCGLNGYTGDGTPASKVAFANDWIKRLLKDQVRGFESSTAGEAARKAAADKADAEVVIL